MEATLINSDSVTSFTFQVDQVEFAKGGPYLTSAEKLLKENVGIKAELEGFSHKNNKSFDFICGQIPGMINALHTAYQSHYALRLSVSDFIVLIGQGLGQHVNKNPEKLRKHFVEFEGKEHIKITRDEFVKGEDNDWSTVFGEFAGQIQLKVKGNVYGIIIDDTSVATPATRIVSEIALMNAVKSFFEYSVMTECGIPQITLDGTPEDWKRLLDKVNKLKELNEDDCLELNWWLDRLVPVVEKICETGISRNADREFWSEIYKYTGFSGNEFISGWITSFFPYLAKGRNPFMTDTITTNNIPKQVSEVPFTWAYYKKDISMKFYGGFLGAEYEQNTKTIKPTYFWCVSYDEGREDGKVKSFWNKLMGN